MIKNTKEIEEFIAANDIDVAQSAIGDTWFVYQTQKEYDNYVFFIRFTTAKELVDIILDELEFELYSA